MGVILFRHGAPFACIVEEWSECDYPALLKEMPRVTPRQRSPSFFWAWPRTLIEQSNAADMEMVTGQGA